MKSCLLLKSAQAIQAQYRKSVVFGHHFYGKSVIFTYLIYRKSVKDVLYRKIQDHIKIYLSSNSIRRTVKNGITYLPIYYVMFI